VHQHRNVPLCASSIRADDYTFLHIQVLPDPAQSARLRIQIVYGHIEEALDLTGVQIHSNDVVAAGRLQHVGHQLRCDGRSRLVFLVLARIWEVRDDCCNPPCGCRLAGIDHDEEFHECIVDVTRGCRL
jgi:hypothetical protein